MIDIERRSAPEESTESTRELETADLPRKKGIKAMRRKTGEATRAAVPTLRMGPTHSGHKEGAELVVPYPPKPRQTLRMGPDPRGSYPFAVGMGRHPGPAELPSTEWTGKGMIGPFPCPNGPISLGHEDDEDDDD